MTKGINLAEQGHVVSVIPPIDLNGGATTGDRFSMANAAKAQIFLTYGVTGAATTVTVEECDDASGSNVTAIAFDVYKEETALGDTLGDRTAVTSSGFTTSTNNGIIYVIDIDAAQLTDGRSYIGLKISDPGSGTLASAVAILSGWRYQEENTGTAIT